MKTRPRLRKSSRVCNLSNHQSTVNRKLLQSSPDIEIIKESNQPVEPASKPVTATEKHCKTQGAKRGADQCDGAITADKGNIGKPKAQPGTKKRRRMTISHPLDNGILVVNAQSARSLPEVIGACDGTQRTTVVVEKGISCNSELSNKASETTTKEDLITPRQYQLELLEAALHHNTIVCLQTGTGKTFIGVMLIKELAYKIRTPYIDGGKRTVFLVNTVPLVAQQASVIKMHTDLSVGKYIGAMNCDIWDGRKWEEEFQKHQVLVMTAQIFLDILHHGFMRLSRVNLLIFDECHHAVKGHPYREIMKVFDTCPEDEYPRVLGLTASIVSSKCSPDAFEENLSKLEKNMRCTAETTSDLSSMRMHGTKPKESLLECPSYTNDSDVYSDLQTILQDAYDFIRSCRLSVPEDAKDPRVKAKQVINDCIHVLTTIGPFALKLFILYLMAELEKDLAVEFLQWPTLFLKYAMTQLRIASKICQVGLPDTVDTNWSSTIMIAPKVKKLLDVLRKFKPSVKEDSQSCSMSSQCSNGTDLCRDSNLCGVVFVERRSTAIVLDALLKEIQKKDPDLNFISSSIVVGAGGTFGMAEEQMKREYKKQEAELKRFRKHEINLLFATSVLEEGVDVPKLNLVVRYDLPKLYGSYIQSRGRARAAKSEYVMLLDCEVDANFKTYLKNFRDIEKILQTKCHGRDQHDDEEINKFMADTLIDPYMPRVEDGAPRVTLTAAIPLVYRYCSKLPNDRYTQLMPRFRTFPVETAQGLFYQSTVSMPTNCSIKEVVYGQLMAKKKLAEMAAALETCERLHKAGELDDHLLPVSHDISVDEEDVLDDINDEDVVVAVNGQGQPGTKTRRQLYKKMVSSHLKDNYPKANVNCYLYKIHMKTAGVCKCDQATQKFGHHLENIPQCFGIITTTALPMIPEFSVYAGVDELVVTFDLITSELKVTNDQLKQLEAFHQCIFAEVLRIGKQSGVSFDMQKADANYLVIALHTGNQKVSAKIDWDLIKDVNETGKRSILSAISSDENKSIKSRVEFQPNLFKDAVVAPIYHNNGEPQQYFVVGIAQDLTVTSLCPDDTSKTFKDYYEMKYNISIQNLEQPLLCVKNVPFNLNFLFPRNNINGCGAPVNKIASSRKKQNHAHLVPELCHISLIPSSLWYKSLCLPSVLHRLNQLLVAEDLRVDTNQDLIVLNQSHLTEQYPVLSLCPKRLLGQQQCTNAECEMVTGQQFGASPSTLLQALTTTNAMDIFNLERLEILGNSFLKFAIAGYLYIERPTWNEGHLTAARSKMVRNRNLYQLGKKKAIPQRMSATMFAPRSNWLPPGFIFTEDASVLANSEICTDQWIADKSIADCVEALIGCFLINCGTINALKFMTNWLGIKVLPTAAEEECNNNEVTGEANLMDEEEDLEPPESDEDDFDKDRPSNQGNEDNQSIMSNEEMEEGEIKDEVIDMQQYFQSLPPASICSTPEAEQQLAHLTQGFKAFEDTIKYRFRNKAYLLQALTHSSYHYNHVTECYQRLEFLGDAILDYLITCHLYNHESCRNMSAGALTDIRSSLVCNSNLAHLAIEYDYYKYMKSLSAELFYHIDNFVKMLQEEDDDTESVQSESTCMSTTTEEDEDVQIEEIPKALGDIFESVAGAIYLDSGLSLDAVWRVYYTMMKPQIEMYITNPPISPVRELTEIKGNKVQFSKPIIAAEDIHRPVQITVEVKEVGTFTGLGKNWRMAKMNAASKALKKIKKLEMKG